MTLKYKFSSTVFISGLIAVIFTYTFYFYTNKADKIQEAEDKLLYITEDLQNHLNYEIATCIDIISAVSCADSVEEAVLKNLEKYSGKQDTEIVLLKKEIEKKWKNKTDSKKLLSEITGSDSAKYFLRIKNAYADKIGEIFLTDKYGITVSSTGKLTTLTHSDKYWWKKTYNNSQEQFFIDDRGFDESVGGYVIGITAPVIIGNNFSGILKINFKLSSVLENIVDSAADTTVARTGGLIIMDKNKIPLSKYLDNNQKIYTAGQNTNSGEIEYKNEKYLIASCRVDFTSLKKQTLFGGSPYSADHKQGNKEEGWVIISMQKKSDALEPLYNLTKSFFIISLIIILIIALIAYKAGLLISKPVNHLVETVTLIGSGDFSAAATLNQKNEFKTIADEVNRMAVNLSKTTASRNELEHEILKRKIEEKKYRNLFNTMEEGFAVHEIITDSNGSPVDYRFLSMNPSFERLTGLKAVDSVGKTIKELLPEIETYWITAYGKVALTGESISFEKYSHDLDKYLKCSSYSPEKGSFAVVFTDITEQKEIEKQLAEKSENLEVTLRSIGDGVITTDASGKIVMLNTVTEKLTGWSNDEAAGQALEKVFNIINEFTRLPCENPVKKVLSTGATVELANNTALISRYGIEYVIEDSAAPIRNSSGEITGVVLVFRDSTEKKKLDMSVLKTQKLESLSVLAGGIAHDFNNLLSGIFGYIELSKSALQMNKYDQAESSLLKTMEVFERTKNLTQQLLTFSKGGSPKREIRNLAEIIKKSAEFAISGSKHTVEFIFDNDLSLCFCDENQISQSIENIVINAIQAMPSGGIIKISAKNIAAKAAYKVNKNAEGNYICITCADTGTGISPEIIKNIFDPFYTTKGPSHGLGLTTVYSIVKHHNGWIDVDSRLEKGTAVRIYLPASNEEEFKKVIREKSGINTGKNILIMDDEDFILDILSEMLDIIGFKAVPASNGDAALEILKESEDEGIGFAACILDLTIPGGKGGLDIINDISNISNNIVTIASSGYSRNPVMAEPEKHGFTTSLRKPFKLGDLEELFNNYF